MNISAIYSVSVIFILASTNAAAQQDVITFSDGVFDSGVWTLETVFDSTFSNTGPSAASASQVPAGGNPDSYRSTHLSFGKGEFDVAEFNLRAVFMPKVQGSIVSIDYSYDFFKIFPVIGFVRHFLAIKQAGSVFVDAGETLNGDAWKNRRHTGLHDVDFYEISPVLLHGKAHPDFPPSAAPLQFGYLIGNDDLLSPGEFSTGLDNWTVSLLVKSPLSWLEVAVSKVKVTQHVVVGLSYVLESSAELKNWTQVGAQFTALQMELVQEFDVDVIGRYYRVRQIP